MHGLELAMSPPVNTDLRKRGRDRDTRGHVNVEQPEGGKEQQ